MFWFFSSFVNVSDRLYCLEVCFLSTGPINDSSKNTTPVTILGVSMPAPLGKSGPRTPITLILLLAVISGWTVAAPLPSWADVSGVRSPKAQAIDSPLHTHPRELSAQRRQPKPLPAAPARRASFGLYRLRELALGQSRQADAAGMQSAARSMQRAQGKPAAAKVDRKSPKEMPVSCTGKELKGKGKIFDTTCMATNCLAVFADEESMCKA